MATCKTKYQAYFFSVAHPNFVFTLKADIWHYWIVLQILDIKYVRRVFFGLVLKVIPKLPQVDYHSLLPKARNQPSTCLLLIPLWWEEIFWCLETTCRLTLCGIDADKFCDNRKIKNGGNYQNKRLDHFWLSQKYK